MRIYLQAIRTVALCGLAATMAGCQGSSSSYPFDRDTVWRVAVGEAIVWRPNLIDGNKYFIESIKTDLAGTEQRYRLEVVRDPNLFARRPSTRIYVRMEQTRPRRLRFSDLEKEFLMRIRARLQEGTPQRPG